MITSSGYPLPKEEELKVKNWEYIKNVIRAELLENDPTWFDKEAHRGKSEFDRGVLAAIAVITHRIDCILD